MFAQQLLSFSSGDQLLKGTADAAVTPHLTPSLALSDQLRVVVDWKTPTAMSFETALFPQAVLELCGALTHSEHPALVRLVPSTSFPSLPWPDLSSHLYILSWCRLYSQT